MCVGYLDRNRKKIKTDLVSARYLWWPSENLFNKKIMKILKNNTNGGVN